MQNMLSPKLRHAYEVNQANFLGDRKTAIQ